MINKFPYMAYDKSGKEYHKINGELSGWIYSDAVSNATCSRCGCENGYHCQTPKGRSVWPPHSERLHNDLPVLIGHMNGDGTMTKEWVTREELKKRNV